MIINETELNSIVSKIIKEYKGYRSGSIGSHAGGEARFNKIDMTMDLNVIDKTPKDKDEYNRIKEAKKNLKPNVALYAEPSDMWSHIAYLQTKFKGIKFYTYFNKYFYYYFDGEKPVYLTPQALDSPYGNGTYRK